MSITQRIKTIPNSTQRNIAVSAGVAAAVAIVGYTLVALYATSALGFEAEEATLSGNVKIVNDLAASGGVALQFGEAPPPVSKPAVPSGLRAIGGGRDIALQWKTPPSESAIERYEVYRDGNKIATVISDESNYLAPLGTRYYDDEVNQDQAYRYQVRATNVEGGTSGLSPVISGSIPRSTVAVPAVSYNSSEAPDLNDYINEFVKPTVNSWYSKIGDVLTGGDYTPRSSFEIIYDRDYKGVAEVKDSRTMVVNPQWARDRPEDLGMYIHEMVHVVQSYQPGTPTALTEGIADWAREYVYYDREPRAPRADETFLNGYSPTSYFANWIQTTGNKPNFINDANSAAHSRPVGYGIFSELTGKSVQQLWFEMTGKKMSGPDLLQTRSNLCADVLNYDTTNGNKIQVTQCVNNSAQQWVHVYKNNVDGTGELRALGSKCMSARDSSTGNATPVVIWDCNGSPGQQWVVQSNGSLKNPNSGRCLDAQTSSGGATQAGAPLQLYDCNNQAWQKWSVSTYSAPSQPVEEEAPAAPINVKATPASDGASVTVSWQAGSGGATVTNYHVFRDNTKITTINATSYKDNNVEQGKTYQYQVQAVSANGKTSPLSSSAGATVPNQSASVAAPGGLVAYTGGNSIAVVWNKSTGIDVREYTLYRNGAKIATTGPDANAVLTMDKPGAHYIDKDVRAGQTYRYEVTVTTSAGDVSSRSGRISAVHPSSTTPVPTIAINSSAAADMDGWMRNVIKPEMEDWYPKTADFLTRPGYDARTSLEIKADPNFAGYAAAYFDSGLIVFNPERLRDNLHDGGVFIHEGIHALQQIGKGLHTTDRAPRWTTEGMGEYMRVFFYQGYQSRQGPHEHESYITPYYGSMFFLNYIQKTYPGANVLKDLNVATFKNTYDGNAFWKRETGKTPPQLWKDMTGKTVSDVGIVRNGSGMCMDLLNYKTDNGNPVQVASCGINNAQKWSFSHNKGSSDTGMLQYFDGFTKCLDVSASGTTNGTAVQIWDCNGSAAQQWQRLSSGEWRNTNSGKCLDAQTLNGGPTQPGARLQIYDCNNGTWQKWNGPQPAGQIIGLAGKCADNFNFQTGNGNRIELVQCRGNVAQQFAFLRETGTRGALMAQGKCIEVANLSKANNALVQLWDCNKADQQQWTIESNGSIRNKLSEKCLQPSNGSSADNTRLVVFDCNGSSAQKWNVPQYSL